MEGITRTFRSVQEGSDTTVVVDVVNELEKGRTMIVRYVFVFVVSVRGVYGHIRSRVHRGVRERDERIFDVEFQRGRGSKLTRSRRWFQYETCEGRGEGKMVRTGTSSLKNEIEIRGKKVRLLHLVDMM
jgi:hypothetical protein